LYSNVKIHILNNLFLFSSRR